jgi:predicted N-acyltransferase
MSQDLTLTLHRRIAEIDPAAWDSCAGTANPFVSHAFLRAVEDSGSAGPRTGWLPQHAAMRNEAGVLVAAAPMYAKSHSYGEYVFDHGWAQAFERAGGQYYPKLQVASPFSPVPGPRLLRHPEGGVTTQGMGQALAEACHQLDVSSVHASFCTEAEWTDLGQAGWLRRMGMQFHWDNQGYASFEDFLGALSSRKRKNLRRERRDANAAGLDYVTLRGSEMTKPLWDAFYRFYSSTVDRKWGSAYLTDRFFPLLGAYLGDAVVVMMAMQSGQPVAGALNLMGADTLYGRNWGSDGEWPFLHFELCYYRAIDFAIEHKLARVEAGAQGQHKIQRGYLPTPTYSAHWIEHEGLRRAVGSFLAEERRDVLEQMQALMEYSPFRRSDEAE